MECRTVNWDRAATTEDEAIICKLEEEFTPTETREKLNGAICIRRVTIMALRICTTFYTIRNFQVMSELWKLAGDVSGARG